MSKDLHTTADLIAENAELRRRIEEAEETLAAIRGGMVDAFLVSDHNGDRVYTLESADRPYRRLVECMQEGAVTLTPEGTILFVNGRMAELIHATPDALTGHSLYEFVPRDQRGQVEQLLADSCNGVARGETMLQSADLNHIVPVLLAISPLNGDGPRALCAVVTDLTHQKLYDALHETQRALQTSEERLRIAAAARGIETWDIDLTTGEAHWSSGHFRVFGYPEHPEGKANYRMWRDRVHPDDWPRVRAATRAARESRSDFAVDYRILRPDGIIVWISQAGRYVANNHGKLTRLLGVFFDNTASKTIEAALRASEERFRIASDAAGALVYDIDLVKRLPAQVHGLERVTGFPAETTPLTSEWWHSRIHHADLPKHLADLERHEAQGERWHTTYRFLHADGTWRRFEDTAEFVRDAQGKVTRLVGAVVDVTQRKLAEESIRTQAAQLRLAADVARMSTYSWNPETGEFVWDDRLKAMFGLSSVAHVDFDTWRDRIHKDDLPRVLAAVDRAIDPGGDGVFNAEYRAIGADDGVERSIIARGQTFFRDGRAVNFIGTALDITERAMFERQLRESEERYRTTFDNAAIGIAHIGRAGEWLRFNRAVCEITGYSAEALRARTFSDITHPDDRDESIRLMQQLWSGALPSYTLEKRYLRPNGNIVWVRKALSVFRDTAGNVQYGIAMVEDITQRKRAEEALAEADRRKDEFLATLAHELRNPLAPIRNGLQLLRLTDNQPQAAENTRAMMDRQLSQMVRLVDDLLDVSRISRGRIELRREPIALAAVVENAVEACRALIDEMDHQLSVELPATPVMVEADFTRLAQVVANLLNNSAKYSDRGGKIALSVEQHENEARIAVRDSGIGIPTDKLTSIFEMFSQVDRSLERAQGGLGIGLSLVKRLVEMHGGSIAAYSAGPGRGAEFVVRLPTIVTPALAPLPEPSDAEAPRGGLRILVVDDNRDGAASLGMLLRLLGHEIRTAHDGQQAIDAADEFRPAVILMDIGMPNLNGYDACRRIREYDWGKPMVMIAMTGWGQDQDRQLSLEAGFDHHLTKPVDPGELRRMLAEIVAVDSPLTA